MRVLWAGSPHLGLSLQLEPDFPVSGVPLGCQEQGRVNVPRAVMGLRDGGLRAGEVGQLPQLWAQRLCGEERPGGQTTEGMDMSSFLDSPSETRDAGGSGKKPSDQEVTSEHEQLSRW